MAVEGEYLNGKIKGKVKLYYRNGLLGIQALYLNRENRKNKIYKENDKLTFESEYLYGKKYNGKGYDGGIYNI